MIYSYSKGGKELEIYERILSFRKSQGLSRRAFGERLGVSESVIANIELNRLARPEQKDPLYKLICKEFHLNEKWLLTGVGDQFLEDLEEDEFTRAAAEIAATDPRAQKLLLDYWHLNEEDKELFWNFMNRFIIKKQEDT